LDQCRCTIRFLEPHGATAVFLQTEQACPSFSAACSSWVVAAEIKGKGIHIGLYYAAKSQVIRALFLAIVALSASATVAPLRILRLAGRNINRIARKMVAISPATAGNARRARMEKLKKRIVKQRDT
jgi:hypothetical protein